MNTTRPAIAAIAAFTMIVLVAGAANSEEIIDVTQSGANVSVTATGSLNLTGATYDHSQPYSTGIIPGGSNWYVALGTTPGMDWYQLTGVDLPFGTSGNYYTSSSTSGDAISIWGYNGAEPLVGVSSGYVSGSSIDALMTIDGETITGMGLLAGTYVFDLPDDTIELVIAGPSSVPEPGTLALFGMALLALGGLGLRRKFV